MESPESGGHSENQESPEQSQSEENQVISLEKGRTGRDSNDSNYQEHLIDDRDQELANRHK